MQHNDGMGLQALTSAILEDAHADAARIVSSAKAEAELNLRKAREEAAVTGQELLQEAKRDAEHTQQQGKAAANMDARALLLSRREKVLSDVLEGARERLRAAPTWSGYDEIVRRLVREATDHLNADEMVIHGDERAVEILNQRLLGELAKERGVSLRVGEPVTSGAGVILETADGHRRYDNTLDARLVREWDRLRTAVYRILLGERP